VARGVFFLFRGGGRPHPHLPASPSEKTCFRSGGFPGFDGIPIDGMAACSRPQNFAGPMKNFDFRGNRKAELLLEGKTFAAFLAFAAPDYNGRPAVTEYFLPARPTGLKPPITTVRGAAPGKGRGMEKRENLLGTTKTRFPKQHIWQLPGTPTHLRRPANKTGLGRTQPSLPALIVEIWRGRKGPAELEAR